MSSSIPILAIDYLTRSLQSTPFGRNQRLRAMGQIHGHRDQGSTRPRPSTFPRQSWPPLPLTLGVALVSTSVNGPLELEKASPMNPAESNYFWSIGQICHQKKGKDFVWQNLWFTQFCPDVKLVVIYAFYSLSSTWWRSILPSHTLPLKPIKSFVIHWSRLLDWIGQFSEKYGNMQHGNLAMWHLCTSGKRGCTL